MQFQALFNYFKQNNQENDDEEGFRANIFIAVMLIFISICFFDTLYIILTAPLDSPLVAFGASVSLVVGCIFLGILWYYKTTGNLAPAANLFLFALYLSTTFSVFITGGPLYSLAASLLILPSIAACCLLGERNGIRWFILSGITLFVLLVLYFSGYQYPNYVDPTLTDVSKTIITIITFIVIFSVVLVYGFMNRRYKQQRDLLFEKMEHLANHDPLTSLANRTQFEARFSRLLEKHDRRNTGNKLSVFYLDLNEFKQVNDTYGHEVGDQLLQEVAARIRSVFRGDDVVARFGGDEFAIVARGISEESDVSSITNKLLSVISQPVQLNNCHLKISASIGIAHYPHHSQEMGKLLRIADFAMYSAKKNKLGWCIGEPEETDHIDT